MIEWRQERVVQPDVSALKERVGDAEGEPEAHLDAENHGILADALRAEESDLTGCASGRWGDWLDDTARRLELQSVAWAVLLAVLGLTVLHLFLVAQGGRPIP